jgi:hypothetical protein
LMDTLVPHQNVMAKKEIEAEHVTKPMTPYKAVRIFCDVGGIMRI